MMMPKRILVIGGMHGNERLGVDLVKLLKKQPIKGVDAVIGNPRAVHANRRFVETDLNRSFNQSNLGSYESERAQRLARLCDDYDLVLDFHNTLTPNNNSAFVGVACKPLLFQVCKQFGLADCIEATYDCINKHCPNALSVEISIGDPLDNAEYWYEEIKSMRQGTIKANTPTVQIYRFARRVTWDEKTRFRSQTWKPFKPLSKEDVKQANLKGEIVPIFIGSTLTEYYATLLRKERTE